MLVTPSCSRRVRILFPCGSPAAASRRRTRRKARASHHAPGDTSAATRMCRASQAPILHWSKTPPFQKPVWWRKRLCSIYTRLLYTLREKKGSLGFLGFLTVLDFFNLSCWVLHTSFSRGINPRTFLPKSVRRRLLSCCTSVSTQTPRPTSSSRCG